MKTGPSLADIMSGQFAVSAIIAALYHRDVNGGLGQHVDVSLLDCVISTMTHYASHYLISGDVPTRRGNEGNGGMPSRMFHCADADIMLVAGNDEQYVRICSVLRHPELATDPRFKTNADRVTHRRLLAEVFDPLFLEWQSADVLQALEAAGVPASPIYNLQQVFDDPHIKSRGMSVEIDHPVPVSGKIKVVGHPVKYSLTPVTHYATPPRLGEHTDAVMNGVLGLDEVTIARLRAERVL